MIVFVELLNIPEAPDAGAVNVTLTPETGLLLASLTVTDGAFVKAVVIAVLCGVVLAFALIDTAGPALFVSEKFTDVKLLDDATTLYGPPAVVFAVNAAEATPEAFVDTVIVFVELLNVPDAPDPGAVNVTLTPDTGLFPASLTVTASAFVNAVPIVVFCGVVPALAVIEVGPEAVAKL